jgi:CRP/FNR family cyclic AMP-dependent transcriptional regulator
LPYTYPELVIRECACSIPAQCRFCERKSKTHSTNKVPRMEARNGTAAETWYMDAQAASVFMAAEHLGRRRELPKGTTLYRQGDADSTFYFVLSGRVQVEIFQQDGAEFILELMGAGSLMGEGSAIAGQRRMATATTLEPCVLIEFDYPVVKKAFPQNVEFATALMEVVAIKQWVLGMRIQFLATQRPDLRIVELLSRLAGLYGVEDDDGIRIRTPLTHEQVAALTGTSRVTVTRTIMKLKSEGVILNEGRHFWVRIPNACAREERRAVA